MNKPKDIGTDMPKELLEDARRDKSTDNEIMELPTIAELQLAETVEEYKERPPSFAACEVIVDCTVSLPFAKPRTYKQGQRICVTPITYKHMNDSNPCLKPANESFRSLYKRYDGQDLTGKTLFAWRAGGIGDLLFIRPILVHLKKEYGDYGRQTAEFVSALSAKQRKFCAQYLIHGKPAQAWHEAGFAKHSSGQAHNILNVPKVAAYLNLLAAKRAVDLKQASSAEMLVRIKATPVLSKPNTPLPKSIQRVTKNLEGGIQTMPDEKVLDLIAEPEPVTIMQIQPVTLPSNSVFGPDWVLESLIRTAERCMQIEAVFDTKGRPIGQFKFQLTQALRALELAGKSMALFTDRIEHAPLEAYEGSELDERIKALMAEHPELKKYQDRIDTAAKPKVKKATPHQRDPDFVSLPKDQGRKKLVH